MLQENPQTAADPWASLSASEDDLSPDATLVEAQEEPSIFDDDDSDAVGDEAAGVAAEANEAAVTAAVLDIEREPQPTRGGAFTIPMLCAGIAIIAACLIIPQTDANRRLIYERARLQADLEAVEKQVGVNDEFLRKVADDPNLAERLAQRQMKIIRQGTRVLEFKKTAPASRDPVQAGFGSSSSTPGLSPDEMSPFQLTAVQPPPEVPAYQPRGGILASLCYSPRSRLYLMGIGLMAMAGGLVLGFGPRHPD